MPLWEHDKMEEFLKEFFSDDLSETRKAEMAVELRNHHTQGLEEEATFKENVEKLTAKNTDLKSANAELFLTYGRSNPNKEEEKIQEEKEFSETVTIEELSKEDI